MSAMAPAGSASSMTGRLSAASTKATSDGDDERDVISHPAPTSCIHVPTFDTMVAIHRPRKRRFFSGLQADGTLVATSGDARCGAGAEVMSMWGASERSALHANCAPYWRVHRDCPPELRRSGSDSDRTVRRLTLLKCQPPT